MVTESSKDHDKQDTESVPKGPESVEIVEIVEVIDIEECITAGREVPEARRYRYRVNKQHFESDKPEISREQILERAKLLPVNQYRLSKKRRHAAPEEIKPGEIVDLRRHGVERFIAQHCEVQDGRENRKDFSLSQEDTAFLDSLGLRWEALRAEGSLWVIIYDLVLPAGFHQTSVDVAIQIMPGYPTAQLDMAYFSPALARLDGKPIPRTEGIQQLDGRAWQRWSRHRIGASVWVPGVDNLERHFIFVQQWLARETV